MENYQKISKNFLNCIGLDLSRANRRKLQSIEQTFGKTTGRSCWDLSFTRRTSFGTRYEMKYFNGKEGSTVLTDCGTN